MWGLSLSSTFIKHLPCISKPQQFHRKSSSSALQIKSHSLETLTPHQHNQLSLYVDALLQWNQNVNLTAVTEKPLVMDRHVRDSLALIPPILHSSSSATLNLVDVGSGAGLPGLILAIARPHWNVTLIESMNKRCLFLDHAVAVTGLSNVRVLRGRAESFGQSVEFREAFDVAVARAVAELRVLAEYCLPLVRVGGAFVAAKGHDPREEVDAARRVVALLGASVSTSCLVDSYGPFGQRTAVVCVKDRPTPKRYPRDPGTPAKFPLSS